MKITIYVDESGDFTTTKGRWLLAALVVPEEYEVANRKLINALSGFPAEFGYKGIQSLHLTEIRKAEGSSIAVSKANTFIERALSVSRYASLIGTINHSKVQVSDRETTYRMMLVDLLSMLESALPEGDVLEKLDLVIAKRTINGVPQTTNEVMRKDVLRNLPQSLEVDLASRGIVDLLGRKVNVHLEYANDSWGLVAADFLANILYNGNKKPESRLIEGWLDTSKLTLLKSFSQLDRRRALVAELNGNHLLAITRWMEIYVKEQLSGDRDELKRCLVKFLRESGSSWASIGFESLIERIWRLRKGTERWECTARYLDILGALLDDIANDLPNFSAARLKFRINNLKAKALNHIGDTKQVEAIIEEQTSFRLDTANNPDLLIHAFDFELIKCEFYFNELNFEESYRCAKTFFALVSDYTELSSLLYEDVKVDKFESGLYRKALLNLIRHRLNLISSKDIDWLTNAINDIENCMVRRSSAFEQSRCIILKALLQIGLQEPKKALSTCMEYLKEDPSNLYVLNLALRISAIETLSEADLNPDSMNRLLDLASKVDFSPEHPKEILYRHLSIIAYLNGDISGALNLIRKSTNAMPAGNAQIIRHAIEINQILHNVYKGKKELAFDRAKETFSSYTQWNGALGRDRELLSCILNSAAV